MIPTPFWKGGAPFAPIALLTHAQKSGTAANAPETTSAIDTTGATLLVVGVISYSTFSMSDSKSNTWLTAVSQAYAGDSNLIVRLMYAQNATVGSGHTFTVTSVGTAFAVASFSNVATSALDQAVGGGSVVGNGSGTPGGLTPGFNNELWIGVDGTEPTVTNVIDTPSSPLALTEIEQIHGVGSTHYGVFLSYGVQNAAALETVTFTWTGGNINLYLAGSFKHT